MQGNSVSRREFGRRVAIGATALPIAGCAAETPGGEPDADKDKRNQSDQPGVKKDAAPPDQAELLLDVVAQQYPHKNLDEKVQSAIRQEIAGNLRRSKVLSRFPLANADEPVFVFAAYRG